MRKTGTRKRWPERPPEIQSPAKSAKVDGVAASEKPKDPFPSHPRPTAGECRAVRDDLLALHGFPQEFAKYRKLRQNPSGNGFSGGETDGGPERESVLDGLVRTVLSQNTTDANSQRAFASLKSAFPAWEEFGVGMYILWFIVNLAPFADVLCLEAKIVELNAVLTAESKCIEATIRCGGLAPSKTTCIKNILSCLLEKKGKICLEYLRDLTIDEIKAELSCFKGIGPKTVACVLMFHLQQDDFPVDTHVFQIAKTIGWIPAVADRNKTYLHLNNRIPNELKFDLNCLLFTHGKLCRKCSSSGSKLQGKESDNSGSCPLLRYCGDVMTP